MAYCPAATYKLNTIQLDKCKCRTQKKRGGTPCEGKMCHRKSDLHSVNVYYTVLCLICTLQPDSTPFNELENFTPEKEVSSHFDIVKHFLTFSYLGFVTLLHQPGTVFGLSCTTGPIKKIGNSLMDSFWTWTCIGSDAVLKTFLSHDAMH